MTRNEMKDKMVHNFGLENEWTIWFFDYCKQNPPRELVLDAFDLAFDMAMDDLE